MSTDFYSGFDPSQKLPCRFISGFKPIETGWFTAQLVYTAPDGRCFTYADGKSEHIGTVDEIEQDRATNDGRWFGLITPVENLGEHAPADEKLYASLGIETYKEIAKLEAEFPPDSFPGIARYARAVLPIEHPWGLARIDIKPTLEPIYQSLLDNLVHRSVELLRQDALPRGYRAAKLAWDLAPSDRRAWALVLRTADDVDLARHKEDIQFVHKGSSDKPDDPDLFSELNSLADHLAYD